MGKGNKQGLTQHGEPETLDMRPVFDRIVREHLGLPDLRPISALLEFPNGFKTPADWSFQIPNIVSGPVEERFTRITLDHYALAQLGAAPYPLVPLFEMYGQPPASSHLEREPSLGTVGVELAAPGNSPIQNLPSLKGRRDTYREIVQHKLGHLRALRERQRMALMMLPGVSAAPEDTFDTSSVALRAAGFWAVLCDLPTWILMDWASVNVGRTAGVLAPGPLRCSPSAGPLSAADLEEAWTALLSTDRIDEPEPVCTRLRFALPSVKESVIALESQWRAAFGDAVDSDRVRQLYEVLVLEAVDGTQGPQAMDAIPTEEPPAAYGHPDAPYPRHELVKSLTRADAKWVPLGQWIVNEAMTTAKNETSMERKAKAIGRVLRQIIDGQARPGYREEWVVDFVRGRNIRPETFGRKALGTVLEHHRAGDLNQGV